MQQPSLIKHLRDVILLPFMVTVVIPYLIYNENQVLPDNTGTKILGLLFLSAGLILFFYTVFLFRVYGKGTLAPWTPTQTLIIRGPYKYCRNPMITGVFFILIGECFLLRSANMLIWTFAFFLINTFYFILKEEPDLYKRFGEEYKKYKKNVPRWIPRVRPYVGDKF